MKKKCEKKCNRDRCPIFLGFEVFFQGEDDEIEAREKLLPLLKKFYDWGESILAVKEKYNKTPERRQKDARKTPKRHQKGGEMGKVE